MVLRSELDLTKQDQVWLSGYDLIQIGAFGMKPVTYTLERILSIQPEMRRLKLKHEAN